MSRFLVGNLYLLGSMCCVTVSHIMIKALIDQTPDFSLSWSTVESFLTRDRLLRGFVAGVFLVAGFLTWLLSLSKLELSYAYPVASCSVLFISLFSVVVLGEALTMRMWIGTALILVGVILLRPTNGG